ncbi:MAG: hypothetical protein WC627_11055 [Legionella sp.]|jgi:photosystem II stability/assembly factor-like uncharacterized protein
MEYSNSSYFYGRARLLIIILLISNSLHAAVIGLGIGGGGAMSGISFDPYQSGHMYIGTDMGLVYESFDLGVHWNPIDQTKISFMADLNHPSHMGFSPNGSLYWAAGGCMPKMSKDRGKNWEEMGALNDLLPKNCLADKLRIKYWVFAKEVPHWLAVGTTNGLYVSNDEGKNWQRLFQDQESFTSLVTDKNTLYHASSAGIFKLDLDTLIADPILAETLSNASMGSDKDGITIVGVEKTDTDKKRLFIKKHGNLSFMQQELSIGDFILMSPVNSSLIYYTGSVKADEGAAIWLSKDAGEHWKQIYLNDEYAYLNGIINPNPIGLYKGFWDSRYHDCQLSSTDTPIIACSGNFFFKRSLDNGLTWSYPYSIAVDPKSQITAESFWQSTQLNPVSVFVLKRHPTHPEIIIAGLADIGCVLSQDNGLSWRMCTIPQMNSIYDVAFNPNNPKQIYAAASSAHDFPQDWHGDILNDAPGGIYFSEDLGLTWKLLSPNSAEFKNPYLSLALDYHQKPCHIYAGTQGKGVIASTDCGLNWQRLNEGFESEDSSVSSSEQKGSLIFPKIRISPVNGDVYALHSGNRLWREDNKSALAYIHYTGLYLLNKQTMTWHQLGRPAEVKAPNNGGLYWKYPIDFAIDWSKPEQIYLVDMTTAGVWKIGGLWYTGDRGESWQQLLQFDFGRRIIIKDNKKYFMGWADPNEPFIYTAGADNVFKPLEIQIPLQRVNDVGIEDNGYLFGTFGGGLFRISY